MIPIARMIEFVMVTFRQDGHTHLIVIKEDSAYGIKET